jgi:hypothetical protein
VTIADAAKDALQKLGKPATVGEIHQEIVKRKLFTFKAKDPVSILGSALRRRTEGSKSLRGTPLFVCPTKGQYGLKR